MSSRSLLQARRGRSRPWVERRAERKNGPLLGQNSFPDGRRLFRHAAVASGGSAIAPPRNPKENAMTVTGKAVLVTGANRGIGQALGDEAVGRGARRVYAGTRQPLAHHDARVTPLILDVTDDAQIQAAVETVE